MRQLKISESITDRSNRSLTAYLNDISKYDILTVEEEVSLVVQIRHGDSSALNRLISCNLRFVISIAKQFQFQGIQLVDLINEGNMGLVTAAKRFDETRGFKFISYAVWWIRQSIMSAISTQSRVVRIPLNQVQDLIKLKRSHAVLEQQLERDPTVGELAQSIGVSEAKINDSIANAKKQISVDMPSSDISDVTLLDVLADGGEPTDHETTTESLSIQLQEILKLLPSRERLVLNMFYGLQNFEAKSYGEIGRHLGITSERVRQIKTKALHWLQYSKQGKQLASYL